MPVTGVEAAQPGNRGPLLRLGSNHPRGRRTERALHRTRHPAMRRDDHIQRSEPRHYRQPVRLGPSAPSSPRSASRRIRAEHATTRLKKSLNSEPRRGPRRLTAHRACAHQTYRGAPCSPRRHDLPGHRPENGRQRVLSSHARWPTLSLPTVRQLWVSRCLTTYPAESTPELPPSTRAATAMRGL